MGACNLGSLFLHNFVKKPFTNDVTVDYEKLKATIKNSVRLLDGIIDINKFPHKAYENYQKNMRTIGNGITGLADMIVMLNMKYGSIEAVDFTDNLMNFIAKECYRASIELSKEKGQFPFLDREKFVKSGFIQKHIEKDSEWQQIADDIVKYGIRNSRIISIAPAGTLSLTFGNNCSSGLEPIFSLEYERKVKIGGQDDSNIKIVKMRDYAYELWLNTKENNIVQEDKFVTAMNLSVIDHLEMLRVIAYHTDMSCSKTINIPTEYPFEATKEVYTWCWKKGIKGCTIFRPNPLRQGILISPEQSKSEEIKETTELKRGIWKPKADDTIYHERKIYIGCGKLKLFIGWSQKENCLQDLYIKRSGQGGCLHNLESTIICMSGMLRLGGSFDNIKLAFKGLGGCNSFVSSRAKEIQLSKGSSCATAILNVIEDFLKEVKSIESKKIEIVNKVQTKEVVLTNEEKSYIKQHGEITFAVNFHKCPLCAEHLEYTGGCLQCSCGWSKCE